MKLYKYKGAMGEINWDTVQMIADVQSEKDVGRAILEREGEYAYLRFYGPDADGYIYYDYGSWSEFYALDTVEDNK